VTWLSDASKREGVARLIAPIRRRSTRWRNRHYPRWVSGTYRRLVPSERVIEAGPISYERMVLCGDPDLEHGLRHAGHEPSETAYRLIEIPVSAIADTRMMAHWRHPSDMYVEAMKAGDEFPPIVVMRAGIGWTLIDGVHRTFAAWTLRRERMVAYELL